MFCHVLQLLWFCFFPWTQPSSHWHYFALLKMLIWHCFPWCSTRERPAAGLGKGHKKQEEKISKPFWKELQPGQRNALLANTPGQAEAARAVLEPTLGLTPECAHLTRELIKLHNIKLKKNLFKTSWIAAASLQLLGSVPPAKMNLTWTRLLLLYIFHVILKVILARSFNNIREESMQFKCPLIFHF